MAKYLKKFNQHSQYETYISGNDKLLPNVSVCEDEEMSEIVHFNPYIIPSVFCSYDGGYGDILICSYDEMGDLTQIFKRIVLHGSVDDAYAKREYSISDLNTNEGYILNSYAYSSNFTFTFILEDTIHENAFDSCSELLLVKISDGIKTIDYYAFSGCSKLSIITIPNSVTTINDSAFSFCTSLKTIAIPNSVTIIGATIFLNCSNLESVTLPNNITAIPIELCRNCIKLESISIPSGVTSIGESAFEGCSMLPVISIPAGVTSIGESAFKNCSLLQEIYFEGTTPPSTLGPGAFLNLNSNCTIYVPTGCVSAYQAVMLGYNYNIEENPDN